VKKLIKNLKLRYLRERREEETKELTDLFGHRILNLSKFYELW